jgi:DMSO/TMAO reductase YedYZ molybdopterin-dependent catalytic subunit
VSLLPTIGVAVLSIILPLVQQPVPATTATAELRVGGEVATPLTLSVNDLKKLPRTTVKVLNPHDHKEEIYEGVAVQELLGRAGVPQKEKLRGSAMAMYVLAEASDGYRVVYALAELDSDFQDSDVIIADTMNGGPLGEKQGPFKMVAPHDKRPARSIRMLKSMTVVIAPSK